MVNMYSLTQSVSIFFMCVSTPLQALLVFLGTLTCYSASLLLEV